MRAELAATRARTGQPFHGNFWHAQPAPDPQREAAWRGLLAPNYREHGFDVAGTLRGWGGRRFSPTSLI
jgi:nitronate monooxygenase